MKKVFVLQILVLSILFCSCWQDRRGSTSHETTPPLPDYNDASQWYIVDRQAPVDFFYIVSTETGDYRLDNFDCHFAHTYREDLRQPLRQEMREVDSLLSGGLNFYSPFYRQCSLETFASDSLVEARTPLAMGDVAEAFRYYLRHYNNGRPFILGGFSQGGMAVVELLRQLSPQERERMVAAYVIGWRVTDDDLATAPFLRPAQDSTDVGVVVCYNSVRDNSCAMPLLSDGNRFAINPVNWRTDATPAKFTSPICPNTLTATLDTATLLLRVDGYTGTDYIIPLIGREGNYHSLEISLYQQPLRHNLALRAQQFCSTQK